METTTAGDDKRAMSRSFPRKHASKNLVLHIRRYPKKASLSVVCSIHLNNLELD